MSTNFFPCLRRRNLSPSVIHSGFLSPETCRSLGWARSDLRSGWRDKRAATGSECVLRAEMMAGSTTCSTRVSASILTVLVDGDERMACLSWMAEPRMRCEVLKRSMSVECSIVW